MTSSSFGRRGTLLTLALSLIQAPAVLAKPPTPQQKSPPDAGGPVVPIYGIAPTPSPWEVQIRARLAGPFMGFRAEAPFLLLSAGLEVDIGIITVEGGFAARPGAHGLASGPFFNLGAAWTFDDSYATGRGAWQGRVGGALGYDTLSAEYGEYGFEHWHALSASLAVDGTWWFIPAMGLELRLAAGTLIPIRFHKFDTQNISTHQIDAGSLTPFILATIGLSFGRWSL